MKYALYLRRIDTTGSEPKCTEIKVVDRLCSTGLECCHPTRKGAQAHADVFNAKRGPVVWRASLVKVLGRGSEQRFIHIN